MTTLVAFCWLWFACTTPTPIRTPTAVAVRPTPTPTSTRMRLTPTPTLKMASDCCTAHIAPGCSNTACKNLICTVISPWCCISGWVSWCAANAKVNCDVCWPPTPTPTPIAPQCFGAICRDAVPMTAFPTVMATLADVIQCLNESGPSYGDTTVWRDTISATGRIAYLPTQMCPQRTAGQLCCTDVWDNFCSPEGCNPACDGLYPCIKGGVQTTCRVVGLTSFRDCTTGIVLVLPQSCTELDGVTPAANNPLRYELLNALTGGIHDAQPWWGFEACS